MKTEIATTKEQSRRLLDCGVSGLIHWRLCVCLWQGGCDFLTNRTQFMGVLPLLQTAN